VRLIGYVRVSVSGEGDSLAAQEEAIHRWAERLGHEVVAVERDVGASGTLEVAERAGLARALLAVRDRRAEGIVAHRVDRLSRRLTVQEAVLAEVWKAGGCAFTVDGGEVPRDDADDPYRTFVRQVMGAAAELERGLVVARMQGGRRRKRSLGGHVGGNAPYGFRVEGKGRDARLVPVPDEQAVICEVRRMRSRGLALREIAARLDREGVRSRTGQPWQHTSVASVLRA
jgi:DNA invertase Pin-like site-specific DNA recombinase